jgi:hypothetical protein
MSDDELKVIADETLPALTPEQVGYLLGRRPGGLLSPVLLAEAGYPAAVAVAAEPPPAAPVVQGADDAQPAEDDEQRNARIRRGRHAVQKGHRIEIHGGQRAVIVQQQSRRAPERNKYADLPRGTVSAKKRERLARKNGAE